MSLVGEAVLERALGRLEAHSEGRWDVMRPEPSAAWRPEAIDAAVVDGTEALTLPSETPCAQDVVLGFLGGCHIGDAICAAPLVRRLTLERGCRVFAARHRGYYKVLENNPYLAGYRNDDRINLSSSCRGAGHVVQRLARGFGLSPDPFPKGDLFLSDEELAWAWSVRSGLPRNRPVLLVSAGSVSQHARLQGTPAPWRELIDLLQARFTVLQVATTEVGRVEEATRMTDAQRVAWRPDPILDDCFIVENVDVRRFFALFAIADLFLGTNSGGIHVSAALGVPAIVVLLESPAGFPTFPDLYVRRPWRPQSFLYPDQALILPTPRRPCG